MNLLLNKWIFKKEARPEAHQDVRVFPLIAFNHLLVVGLKGAHATILDQDGSALYEVEIGENGPIDLQGLPSGSYVIQISDRNGTSYYRFQKLI